MYSRYPRRKKSRSGCCLLQFAIVIFLCVALVYTVLMYSAQKSAEILSPISGDQAPSVSLLEIIVHGKNPDELRNLVKQEVGSAWNNYSVSVIDYNSNFVMNINESSIFTAASVNKVPILAALYAQEERGAVDFDQIITLQAADIQDYGTGSIRYDAPGTRYSIKTLARLMIQKSDNTAAYILASHVVGLPVIQKYANTWGMTQTDMVKNKTSNKDIAILFKKIMDKTIVGPALSDEMIGLLKESDFEDRIPGLLPADAIVYHKIGTEVGIVHDAGVVEYGKTKYYVGIFTGDVRDEEQAAERIARISKTIFDYMKS
jgi:beta-lactamase class A